MPETAGTVRVLHISDGLGGGGSEKWLWEIVRASDDRISHRIVTVFPDPGNYVYAERMRARDAYRQPPAGRALTRLYWRLYSADGMRPGLLRKLVGAMWFSLSVMGGVVAVWRASREFRPTVVHAHGFLAYPLGLLASSRSRRRFVHTVPSLVAQMIDAKARWLPFLYGRTHRAVDRFFTSMPSELISLGVPAHKLYNLSGAAVDLDAVALVDRDRGKHRARVRERLGIPQSSFVLLTVGRMHPSKGHIYAIQALGQLPSAVHLIVLGDGPQRSELEREAESVGVASRAHFAGYREDILEHYAAADLYLRVATIEGENMSSLLAMAMRLPIIAFDTRAEIDFIPRIGHGILVRTADVAAVTEAVRRIMGDERLRAELSERAGKFMSELDLRRTVGAYHEFYLGSGELSL